MTVKRMVKKSVKKVREEKAVAAKLEDKPVAAVTKTAKKSGDTTFVSYKHTRLRLLVGDPNAQEYISFEPKQINLPNSANPIVVGAITLNKSNDSAAIKVLSEIMKREKELKPGGKGYTMRHNLAILSGDMDLGEIEQPRTIESESEEPEDEDVLEDDEEDL